MTFFNSPTFLSISSYLAPCTVNFYDPYTSSNTIHLTKLSLISRSYELVVHLFPYLNKQCPSSPTVFPYPSLCGISFFFYHTIETCTCGQSIVQTIYLMDLTVTHFDNFFFKASALFTITK